MLLTLSTLSLVFVFIFGLCIGSFLNVLIYRLPRSISAIKGRSFCPKCKKKILWHDNIPVLSFVLLRGKCRFCHSPISWQYPIVEVLTGVLFLLAVIFISKQISNFQFPIAQQQAPLISNYLLIVAYYLFLISSLIVIFFTDLRYKIIPDEVVYPAVVIAFLFQAYSLQSTVYSFLFSAFGASLFFFILHLFTRGKGMGLGDVKLAFLMGLVLGFPKIIVAFYLAFLTGALIGVILILARKKKFGEQIPFGPFLSGATIIALFWGEGIMKWFTARFF